MTNLDGILKSRDITLPTKVHIVKVMGFFQQSCMAVRAGPSRRLSIKEQCFHIVMVEKNLESPLDYKISPLGNQLWIFIKRTSAKAEVPTLWTPGAKESTHWKTMRPQIVIHDLVTKQHHHHSKLLNIIHVYLIIAIFLMIFNHSL